MGDDMGLSPDQIRITIEMGADYQPSERLASLLGELQAEISDDEVSGYALDFMNLQRPDTSGYLTITMENLRYFGDPGPDGKKKGNVEY